MLRRPFDRQQRQLQDQLLVLGSQAEELLRQSLEAFSERDVELAQLISVRDYEIDDLYVHITRRLLAVSRTDSHAAGQAIHLSHIAHQLERVGDRATNICEWVIYAVTGHIVEMNTEFSGGE